MIQSGIPWILAMGKFNWIDERYPLIKIQETEKKI